LGNRYRVPVFPQAAGSHVEAYYDENGNIVIVFVSNNEGGGGKEEN
jgi:hypothetical protein